MSVGTAHGDCCRERPMCRSLQDGQEASHLLRTVLLTSPSEAKASLWSTTPIPLGAFFRRAPKSLKLHRKGQPIVARNNFVPPTRLPFAVKFLEFLEIGLPAIQFSLHPKEGSKRGLGQRPKVLPHSLLCYSAEDVENQLEKDGQRAAGYEEAEHQREDSDRLGKAGLGLIGLHG